MGTPEELRTLYHSSFVRLPFPSLSALSKYLRTWGWQENYNNKSFKLTSRRFLISMSGVTQELPLLRKLMSTALYCTSGRTKAQKSELDPLQHQGVWALPTAIGVVSYSGGGGGWASSRVPVSTCGRHTESTPSRRPHIKDVGSYFLSEDFGWVIQCGQLFWRQISSRMVCLCLKYKQKKEGSTAPHPSSSLQLPSCCSETNFAENQTSTFKR